MFSRARRFRPFAASGRRTILAVVEVAGLQRTLAERYVKEVLLVRAGQSAEPALTASLSVASGTVVRRQLVEEQHLVGDLAASGAALSLTGRS